VIDFDTLAAHCAPHVAPSTLRALAQVESGFNPYAIGVVGGALTRQPRNLPEAISTVRQLRAQNIKFSAGLAQIYFENWPAYQLDYETVFEPCANLRAAQGVLANCYQRASIGVGAGQLALRQAISCYYSDNFVTGFREGYVQKVVAAAASFRASAQKNSATSGS
jgi:type IV secretion system protein VirB1